MPVITPIASLNLILLAIASGLVLYYVIQANIIASSHYRVQTLNEEVQLLSERHIDIAQQQARLEDTSVLTSFAQQHSMVEAKDASYVFEGSNVAYQR